MESVVTRIASNGIRAYQEGYGIVVLKVEINGVWGYEEDRKMIEKLRKQMKFETQICMRCGWEFIPTRVKRDDAGKILDIILPKTCPNPVCNSPYWDKPRQVKGSDAIASV